MALNSYRKLRPIEMPQGLWDALEEKILQVFKEKFYGPLLAELGEKVRFENASSPEELRAILEAITSGRITFHLGTFSGKFSARISSGLSRMGAKWDRKTETFKIRKEDLPEEVSQAVQVSEHRFLQRIGALDQKLLKIFPAEIAKSIQVEKLFDTALWKVDKDFRENVRSVTLVPEVSEYQRAKVAKEWQDNLQRSIKGFTEEKIQRLRASIRKTYFAGDRYGSLVKTIQKSYGVTKGRAEFWARQESKLLATTFQAARFVEAGLPEYEWHCVTGTAAHPVRARHKELAEMSKRGILFRFDDPPVTTEPGQPPRKNNPGQDYGCRCTAIPVYRRKAA